jgi:stearoyl-CoA desaturase (Delta-9 desaturase)
MIKKIEWQNALFFSLAISFTLILVPLYFYYAGFALWTIVLAVILAAFTNLSITAGYHRLFAHRSYKAHPVLEFLYLAMGASAWQGSALKWSSDHRRHHNKVDSEEDPYSIKKGFWYAHMGWLFNREAVTKTIQAPDLEKNKLVAFQHKYYVPVAIFMGFGLPALIGWLMGDCLGGLIVAGLMRMVVTQQSTFLVNSLAHTWGTQTYSKDISARDSWLVAFLTHGEGFHNFHHKFQSDYRNGIRWYQWDPTKWTIRSLSLLGLASQLRRISEQEILKARLQVDEWKLRSKGFSEEKLVTLKETILSTQLRLREKREEYKKASEDKLQEIKIDMQMAQLEFEFAVRQWTLLLRVDPK